MGDKMKVFLIQNGILKRYVGNDRRVVIPDEVTVIGESAFYSCHTVTSIIIHNRVTRIGDSAFCYKTKTTRSQGGSIEVNR